MAATKLFVEPRRSRVRGPIGIRVEDLCDFIEAGVFEPAIPPLKANLETVFHKALSVAFPHFYGRMVLPSVVGVVQGFQYLQTFDALFAEALVVKRFG